MPLPFYAAQVAAVVDTLQNIFTSSGYADREIAKTLKADKRRGGRDRAFIAEHTYGVVRYYRLYAELLGHEPRDAADWWKIVGIHLALNGYELPDWKEWKGLNLATLPTRRQAITERAVQESIPDWLDRLGSEQLGEKWPATLAALNETAPVVLRANTLRATAEEVQAALAAEGIETELLPPDALLVTKRRNLFATKAFKKGLFEVQDYSSQQAAPALEVEPGMTVVDACAGAGGKSLHLAALMENKGRLLSLDVHGWKLDELKRRARRNGVSNIDTRPITSTKVVKRLYGQADRLLLDVPCTGLGVLRRNPDAKWKLSPEFLERVEKEQADILARYSRMVKAGGKMVYATCSILPRENERQLEKFLASEAGEGWSLEHTHTYLPQVEGYDGFFVSRLARERTT